MARAFEVKHSEHLGYTQNVICDTPTTPKVGDLVLVGDLVGYALQDEDSKGYTVVYFGPMTLLGSVSAVGANITPGIPLYASVNTGVVVVNNTATGKFLGYSLGSVSSGASGTLKFLKEPSITASTSLGTGTITADEIAAGAITEEKIGALAVTAAKIGAGAVTKGKLAGGFLKVSLIDGAAAGDHTVTGMAVGDEIVSVIHISTKADIATMADITSEFTVAAGKATNAAGTDTTNDQLQIIWLDLTA